ncbi:MAG: lactonase family protein [Myxococcales bacterium]|jgi:6-phosphogluconolactonase|nr:lactonase family protein [Myxococcales bacterium]MBL0196534.1 lactonase family protein [Myxococcales bacterium]HQY64712.1 lactonase family protein [Polyangiaceae bacterium]
MLRRALLHVCLPLLVLACGTADVPAEGGGPPVEVVADASAVLDASPADASLPARDGAPDGPLDASPPRRAEVAFVGSGDGNVRTYAVDSATGALAPKGVTAVGGDPSYLAFDEGRRLAFVVDSTRNRVHAYSVDPSTGTLTKKNDVASGGTGATHVSLVPSGRYLLVAHYTSGQLSVVPVAADGTLAAPSDVVFAGEKAHYAQMDAARRTVFVPCLGANVVARYTLDEGSGALAALAPVGLPAGAGPRHLAFAPSTPFAFVVNELQSSVTSFGYDAATGGLTLIETRSSLPVDFAGANTGAAIFAHPAGRYVYSSNRGHDSIARFVVEPTGRLTLDGHVSTSGRTPRSFTLAGGGRFAYVANQASGTVWGYTFVPANGELVPMGVAALAEGLGAAKFVGTARFVDP